MGSGVTVVGGPDRTLPGAGPGVPARAEGRLL